MSQWTSGLLMHGDSELIDVRSLQIQLYLSGLHGISFPVLSRAAEGLVMACCPGNSASGLTQDSLAVLRRWINPT